MCSSDLGAAVQRGRDADSAFREDSERDTHQAVCGQRGIAGRRVLPVRRQGGERDHRGGAADRRGVCGLFGSLRNQIISMAEKRKLPIRVLIRIGSFKSRKDSWHAARTERSASLGD